MPVNSKFKLPLMKGIPLKEALFLHAYEEILPSAEDLKYATTSEYGRYKDDPIAFCEYVLGERFPHDIKKMMLSVRDNPITIAQSANGVGKTYAAARVALWWYKCHPDAQVYTAAAPPEPNLKRLLWGQIGSLVEQNLDVFQQDKVSLPSMTIKRSELEYITGVTIPSQGTEKEREGRFSGKHAPFLLFIIDEGDAVPPEIYKGIESCMSGGVARLLVMFNPRQKVGPVYDMAKNGGGKVIYLNAFRHPNVYLGRDIFPGAVTRETTVRRINLWTAPEPEIEQTDKKDPSIFQVPNFLVGCTAMGPDGEPFPPLEGGYRRVVQPEFSYMVLARYPDALLDQLINESWIEAARVRWDLWVARYGVRPPANVRPIQGLDVADLGDDSNCSTFRYGGWVAPQRLWRGVDPLITGERAFKLYARHQGKFCNVDSTGVGAGVSHHMKRQGAVAFRVMVASGPDLPHEKEARKNRLMMDQELEREQRGLQKLRALEEEVIFHIMRDRMLWSLREWLRTDSTSMLPPDELLKEELIAPTYSKDEKKGEIRVMDSKTLKEILGRSPDRLSSLALTFVPPLEELVGELYQSNYRQQPGSRRRQVRKMDMDF